MQHERNIISAEIAQMGARFDPEVLARTQALYASRVQRPVGDVRETLDVVYGSHDRQKLDVYWTNENDKRPLLVYVPGGGFVGGDKRMTDVFYANVARWFVKQGFVVITMNYRLAPEYTWPAGANDVGMALGWAAIHGRGYGVDPNRMFLFGQSAGASHVSTFLFHPAINRVVVPVKGAILASGLYDATKEHREAILSYFGNLESERAARSSLPYVEANPVPVLLSVAELDPAFLTAQTFRLAEALTKRDRRSPPFLWMKGHNHVSTVLSFDSGDEVMGSQILEFVKNIERE